MPKIVMEQGTDEWKAWRKTKITATSASIIMGSNPWKTQEDLWNEMLGFTPPQEMNAAMMRGSELEEPARNLFMEISGLHFEPCLYESDEFPWMAASLDGISHLELCDAILEIKCPGEKSHLEACEGKIKPYYYDQMQHQLAVTGASMCYYFSYRPECTPQYIVIEVYPDVDYQEIMIKHEYEFYKKLCNFDKPVEWEMKQR